MRKHRLVAVTLGVAMLLAAGASPASALVAGPGGSRTVPLVSPGQRPSVPIPQPIPPRPPIDQLLNVCGPESRLLLLCLPRPNLTVTKTPDANPVETGATITWTIEVSNSGEAAATITQIILQDQVDPSLSNVSLTGPAGYACTQPPDTLLVCAPLTSDSIEAGDSRIFTMTATAPDEPGTVTNSVLVDPNNVIRESNEEDNTATSIVTVEAPALPNLRIRLADVADPVATGETMQWRSALVNAGEGNATIPSGTPVIRFRFSADLSDVTITPPPGYECMALATPGHYGCRTTTEVVLAAGDYALFEISATAPSQPADITLVVDADPRNLIEETNETDNLRRETTSVIAMPDLTVEIQDRPDPVEFGQALVYRITVDNAGDAPVSLAAGDTLVRVTVPAGLTGVSVTAAGYTCTDAGGGTWNCTANGPATIAAGDTVTLRLEATAPDVEGDVTVSATADPNDVVAERDETNNQASEVTTVIPPRPNLNVEISDATDPIAPGGAQTWTMTINNTGDADANFADGAAVLEVRFPAGTTGISFTAPAGYACSAVTARRWSCVASGPQTIAMGGNLVFTANATMTSTPGTYDTRAMVDPADVIDEQAENDNRDTSSTTVAEPAP